MSSNHFLHDGEYVLVYVDGACINNGSSNAYAGYGIVFGDNHRENLSSPIQNRGRVTSDVAEAQAATKAIQIAARNDSIRALRILTDSQMLVEFRRSLRIPENDVGDFLSLKQVFENNSKQVEIDIVKVPGHSGNKYNDMADALAKKGAEEYARINRIPH